MDTPRTPSIRPDAKAFLDRWKANGRPALTAQSIAEIRALAPQNMAMLARRGLSVTSPHARLSDSHIPKRESRSMVWIR
jgi:hypothetical protein